MSEANQVTRRKGETRNQSQWSYGGLTQGACLLAEKLMGIAALNPSYKVVLRYVKGYE